MKVQGTILFAIVLVVTAMIRKRELINKSNR